MKVVLNTLKVAENSKKENLFPSLISRRNCVLNGKWKSRNGDHDALNRSIKKMEGKENKRNLLPEGIGELKQVPTGFVGEESKVRALESLSQMGADKETMIFQGESNFPSPDLPVFGRHKGKNHSLEYDGGGGRFKEYAFLLSVLESGLSANESGEETSVNASSSMNLGKNSDKGLKKPAHFDKVVKGSFFELPQNGNKGLSLTEERDAQNKEIRRLSSLCTERTGPDLIVDPASKAGYFSTAAPHFSDAGQRYAVHNIRSTPPGNIPVPGGSEGKVAPYNGKGVLDVPEGKISEGIHKGTVQGKELYATAALNKMEWDNYPEKGKLCELKVTDKGEIARDFIFSPRVTRSEPKLNAGVDLLAENVPSEEAFPWSKVLTKSVQWFSVQEEHGQEKAVKQIFTVREGLKSVESDSIGKELNSGVKEGFRGGEGDTLKPGYGVRVKTFVDKSDDSPSLPRAKQVDLTFGKMDIPDSMEDTLSHPGGDRSNPTEIDRHGSTFYGNYEGQSFLGVFDTISEKSVMVSVSKGTVEHPGTFTPPIIDQVAEGIITASREGGRVRISLQPETLGKVNVDLLVNDDRVKLVVVVESEGVKNIIKSGIEDLRSSLQQQGLQIGSMDVVLHRSLDQRDFGTFGGFGDWSGNGTFRSEGSMDGQDFCSEGGHLDHNKPSVSGEDGNEGLGERRISIFA